MRPLQKQIIETLKVQPKIDVQEEVKRTIQFLKEYLVKHPFLKGYVLGISGGQDSTLAGKLTQLAIDELKQEYPEKDYRFYAVRLPYGIQADEQDAMDAIEFMQASDVLRVDIKPAVDASTNSITSLGYRLVILIKGILKQESV